MLGAAPLVPGSHLHGLSGDARYVLLGTVSLFEYRPHDRVTGLATVARIPESGAWVSIGRLSGDGNTVVIDRDSGTVKNPYVHHFLARLDADSDGLNDGWEATFALDASNALDAALDPDGDGLSSGQEYAAVTHPRGTPVRYFAEGANGSFFATSLALLHRRRESGAAGRRAPHGLGSHSAVRQSHQRRRGRAVHHVALCRGRHDCRLPDVRPPAEPDHAARDRHRALPARDRDDGDAHARRAGAVAPHHLEQSRRGVDACGRPPRRGSSPRAPPATTSTPTC